MTHNNRKFTNYQTRNAPSKPLTDYAPELALKRTRFYLDVMEAHFAELDAFLEDAKAQGMKTIPNPFYGKKVVAGEVTDSSMADSET
jgi:hypothetical protein